MSGKGRRASDAPRGSHVPSGTVVLSDRLKDSKLHQALKSKK